jgi:hypothetical protein
MNKLIENLLSCLTSEKARPQDYEHWGLLLSLVVEKHSKLRSPEPMYAELLPKAYREINLGESEYVALVTQICEMLVRPTLPAKSQDALVFALCGTDDTTLNLTVPSIVNFLSVQHGENAQTSALRCLRKMLSEPDGIRKNAAQIRSAIPPLSKVRLSLQQSLSDSDDKSQAATVIDLLAGLLDSSG